MKVSDLIKILEEHKDKNLYFLNIATTNEVVGIKKQIIYDDFFLEFKQKPEHKFITDFNGLKEGFSIRLRSDGEMEALKKAQARESRQFNYFFEEGAEVMLDEYVIMDIDKERLSHLFGKIGIVKKCHSDLHSFAHGSSYCHVVEWSEGEKTQDGDFGEDTEYDSVTYMPKNYVPTIYLKAAE